MKPDKLSARLNKLPRWARDYIHHVQTFVGAQEVEELILLRDQNRHLSKAIAELKAENRRQRTAERIQRLTLGEVLDKLYDSEINFPCE